MWNILKSTFTFLWNLVVWVWDFVLFTLTWLAETAWAFHTEMPRLEGLLVGLLFAWWYHRRDKHPLPRVLSAPLKLVIDILDALWDRGKEELLEVLSIILAQVKAGLLFAKNSVAGAYHKMMSFLTKTRNDLQEEGEE